MSTDGKSPGFWFYTADYERDMQILSLAAQGLWTRMLCWMHENEAHRGFLELPTGAPMTTWDIGAKVGKPIREIERCITEMERVGIFSRDTRGCIYSRRMARDIHISTVRRNAANSRHETATRAADGKFAGGFAGAKQSSKMMQNPSVTASASASVSDSTVKENTSSKRGLLLAPMPPATPDRTPDDDAQTQAVRKMLHTYTQRFPIGWSPPDEEICRRTLIAAGGSVDELQRRLLELARKNVRPKETYGWFPVAVKNTQRFRERVKAMPYDLRVTPEEKA